MARLPDVYKAFEIAEKRPHYKLIKNVALKLKRLGYRILSVEHSNKSLKDVSEDELRYKIALKLCMSYSKIVGMTL